MIFDKAVREQLNGVVIQGPRSKVKCGRADN